MFYCCFSSSSSGRASVTAARPVQQRLAVNKQHEAGYGRGGGRLVQLLLPQVSLALQKGLRRLRCKCGRGVHTDHDAYIVT